jgi:transglutaminase-like putative cysteine protease
MTARSRLAQYNDIPRWQRRLSQIWSTLFAPGDLLTLIIALGLLLMPAFALNAAGWPLDLRTLLPVAVLSIVVGFLLARSQYHEFVSLIMTTLYGVGLIALIAAINEPGDLREGAASAIGRTLQWITDASTGGINQDELAFTLLVSALFWFLGYNIAWHLFRVDRVWRVILPAGLLLVTNTLYYTGDVNLDTYLLVFIFLALLLVVRSTLDARAWEWYTAGIRVPRSLRSQFLRVGALLALVAMLIAGAIQINDLQERLNRFREFLQSEPVAQLSELWNRLFSTAETDGPTTADYYGGDSLQLGGAIRLGEQTVFVVEAPPGRRYYWRSRVFDTYSSGRWSPGADVRLTVDPPPFQVQYEGDQLSARVPVQQRFTLGLTSTRLVYAAPQPFAIDLPTRTDLLYTPNRAGMNVSVIRPLRVLNRGESYTVTSLMSDANATQLRAVSPAYPEWISRQYLQIPPSISDQTRLLAAEIVREAAATTPYDQAKAIESWLRINIRYNEAIPQPPLDRDPMEWVLFDIREGYCNYYATAMVIMLRAQGIPARMVAGFAQGTFDAAANRYNVQERDAHTWVEVFFPGYGWIEFEPTAAQAPLNRVDDAPAPDLPTPTPNATPTPTLTPTPPPTATPNPETPEALQAPQFPTMTPTPSPSPTATPVIVPTQPPPLTPQPRSFLEVVAQALGAALLLIVLILLLVAIGFFIYWWWEWRGMRGLSPITRAYARLERYLQLIGIRFNTQQTPNERRNFIIRRLPKAEPPISAITNLYSAERYGPAPRNAQQAEVQSEIADDAWVEARRNILERFLRRFTPWRKGK